MNDRAYISINILIVLILISLFSFNILNQVNNEIKITGMNINKNIVENNLYNNFIEIVEKEGYLEDKILEAFKDKPGLSLDERIKINGNNFYISFYKTDDGEVKLLVDQKDSRGNSSTLSYGYIIKDFFNDDIINYEGLDKAARDYLDSFIADLSKYESPYIKKYDPVEDFKELQNLDRIKYIDSDLEIVEDLTLEGIIIINGDLIIGEEANLKVAGKLICKNITNIESIDIDRKGENILLYYSKYIPGFLDYRAEVIKID